MSIFSKRCLKTLFGWRFRLYWFVVAFGKSLLNNYTFKTKPAFFSKTVPTFSRRMYICAFSYSRPYSILIHYTNSGPVHFSD